MIPAADDDFVVHASRAAHRRGGIGTAITYAPLNDRLGFATYGEVTEFEPAPEAR